MSGNTVTPTSRLPRYTPRTIPNPIFNDPIRIDFETIEIFKKNVMLYFEYRGETIKGD